MNDIDLEKWEVHDPDRVLILPKDQIKQLESACFKQSGVYPREDLVQITNKQNGKIIDLGFYEDSSSTKGKWIIHIVESNNDWENPIEKIVFNDFFSSILHLKQRTLEYG